MLGLIGNIRFHFLHTRLANGERSVSALPMKFSKSRSLCLDPFGGCPFHLHNDLRQGMIFAQREQNMDMVAPRVYRDYVGVEFPQDRGGICG